MNRVISSTAYCHSLRQRLRYQFYLTQEEADKFIPLKLELEFSAKTKRVRYIYVENELWGVLRPTDGIFLLTPSSAKFLVGILKSPKLRVIIQTEVSEYIQKGGNVFAKHVIDCDPILTPHSEVIVVDANDIPLALGRLLLNREEALAFKTGIAVKVRKGI
ncbi:MAG: pseudouridine synthase [Candidatus Helarchaeota archaeon]|nr:pseudouridine synthase [Candidatus Helarchaeota archaeon]